MKRLPCYSHKLQLVLNKFDLFRKPKKTASPLRGRGRGSRGHGRGLRNGARVSQPADIPIFATVINKAQKLVTKFNGSSYAVPMLIRKTNKKLCADVTTSK